VPEDKTAVALRYDPGAGELPCVTARGRGLIAEQILELAAEHGIPVRRNPDLAQLLARLAPGTAIPAEAFAAVAAILAALYRLDTEGPAAASAGGE